MKMQNRIKNIKECSSFITVVKSNYIDVCLKKGIITPEEYQAVYNGKTICIEGFWVVVNVYLKAIAITHAKIPRPRF